MKPKGAGAGAGHQAGPQGEQKGRTVKGSRPRLSAWEAHMVALAEAGYSPRQCAACARVRLVKSAQACPACGYLERRAGGVEAVRKVLPREGTAT